MRKSYLIGLTILLVIGFAAVSTILTFNGTIKLGFNERDFDVYFSKVMLDEEEKPEYVSEDKKEINFEIDKLSLLNEQKVLTYEVTNNSTQYDAEVKVECTPTSTDNLEIENSFTSEKIVAQSTASGTLSIKLTKVTVEEESTKITCTIKVVATEKTEKSEYVVDKTASYSMGMYVYEGDTPVSNKSFVIYSENPQYVESDEDGYLSVSGLEWGNHEIYYMGESNIEELKNKTKDEIKSTAEEHTTVKTTDKDISFGSLTVEDFLIGETSKLKKITFKGLEEEIVRLTNTSEIILEKSTFDNVTALACPNDNLTITEEGYKISDIEENEECLVTNKLEDLLNKEEVTEEIILNKNYTISELFTTNHPIKININGNTLAANFEVHADLTIKDVDKKGILKDSINNRPLILSINANIILENVAINLSKNSNLSVQGTSSMKMNNSSINIEVDDTSRISTIYLGGGNTTLTLNKSYVEGPYAIGGEGGIIKIYDSELVGQNCNAICINPNCSGDVYISNSTLTAKIYAIQLISSTKVKLVIENNSVIKAKSYYAISFNDSSDITINSATLYGAQKTDTSKFKTPSGLQFKESSEQIEGVTFIKQYLQ